MPRQSNSISGKHHPENHKGEGSTPILRQMVSRAQRYPVAACRAAVAAVGRRGMARRSAHSTRA